MPTISYKASNFGTHWGTKLSGTHQINVSWNDVVWAAVTVGKPGIAHLLTHGWHSISDVIVRSHTVYANLREANGYFEKSTLYNELDPTEKGATSYFMGMVAARLLSDRLLQTPWLLHVSMFQAAGNSVALNGKSQPDLIGVDSSGRWVVVEAKGRSNGLSVDAMAKAKKQTRSLRNINGALPNVRVAVQAYFSPQLSFAVEDPEELDDDAIDVVVNEDKAIRNYYSYPHVAARAATRMKTIENREFALTDINEVGISVGLNTQLLELLNAEAPLTFATLRSIQDIGRRGFSNGSQFFADGISIELDERWSKERMSHDPSKRKGG